VCDRYPDLSGNTSRFKKKKQTENQRFAMKYTEAKGKTLYGQLEILVVPGNCSL